MGTPCQSELVEDYHRVEVRGQKSRRKEVRKIGSLVAAQQRTHPVVLLLLREGLVVSQTFY